MAIIRVLRPFVFTYPLTAGERLNRERVFGVGEHEVDDAVASHPWIKAYADGRIESPQQEAARLKAAADNAAELARIAEQSRVASEAAFARLVGNAPAAKMTAEEMEAALNTPVDQLRAKQGAAIASEVNSPVSTLKLKSGPNAKSAA